MIWKKLITNGLCDNEVVSNVIEMCKYALMMHKDKGGCIELYNESKGQSTLQYELKFPILSMSFVDNNQVTQNHCFYVENLKNTYFDKTGNYIENSEILFKRTVTNNKVRMESYKNLHSLANYFNKRINIRYTENFCNQNLNNGIKNFLMFFSLFIRSVKIFDNIGSKIQVVQQRPFIKFSYYSRDIDKNINTGFKLMFYRNRCSLENVYINEGRKTDLEKEINYSDASNEYIDLLFESLGKVLNSLGVKYSDKKYC